MATREGFRNFRALSRPGSSQCYPSGDGVWPRKPGVGSFCSSRSKRAVAFRHVAFAYREGHSVLCDISFEVAPGTRVGIAGPSGAGKTTLVSLLMRFYDPTAGAILVDGMDLRDYKLHDLRNQFAIV